MSTRLGRSRLVRMGALVVLAALAAVLIPLALGSSAQQPRSEPMASLTPAPSSPVTVFVGDSSAAGAGASKPAERWTSLAAATLGWQEKNLAEGGSGYGPDDGHGGCDGATSCTTYAAGIADVAKVNPAVIVVSGRAGGVAQDEKKLTAEVTAYYRSLRAAAPDATIIAVGPWSASSRPTASEQALESAVAAAAKAVRAVHVDLLSPSVLDPTMTTKGGSQLNDVGHQAVADRLVSTLDESTN